MRAIEICKVEAYKRKSGGFSSVVVVRELDKYGLEIKSEPIARLQGLTFHTQEEAFADAYNQVSKRAAQRHITVAHFKSNKFRKHYRIWSE